MTLPAWVPADGPIGVASFTSPTDTGGCTHIDEAFGPCTRPPHADPTHRTRWDGFEARWTTPVRNEPPRTLGHWGLNWW